jgi:heme/copper-type cytochrome/quinol oxidase subunit 4
VERLGKAAVGSDCLGPHLSGVSLDEDVVVGALYSCLIARRWSVQIALHLVCFCHTSPRKGGQCILHFTWCVFVTQAREKVASAYCTSPGVFLSHKHERRWPVHIALHLVCFCHTSTREGGQCILHFTWCVFVAQAREKVASAYCTSPGVFLSHKHARRWPVHIALHLVCFCHTSTHQALVVVSVVPHGYRILMYGLPTDVGATN